MANEVVIRIKGDSSHAERSIDAVTQKTRGMGDAFALAGKVAAGAAAALAVGLGAAAKMAVDFEASMSGVKAVSGATGAEMAQLSKLALQLGKDTSFTATQAAQGIEELVKGGISVADIMGGAARASLNLAAAGEIDLASAAEIAANAMNQFSLKGEDMAKVSDLIAGAANASSLGVNDFKLSLSQVGAVAAVSGQTFESTAQAIAVMGAAGIKGSDAGTSLKTMLLNLNPSTKKASDLFRELGITTRDGANQFFDAAGKAKSMRDIAEILRVSMAGLTDQQRLAKLEIMFGSDAMRASAILAKAGAEGFDKMAESMGKVTAAGVAAERLNNVKGAMEQLMGSIEVLGITIASRFLPGMKGVIDQATEGVNALTSWIEKVTEGGNAAEEAGNLIREMLGRALEWIKAQVPVVAEALGKWANEMVDWVIRAVPQLIANATTMLGNLLSWLTENAPVLAEKLIGEWVPAAVAWVAEAAVRLLKELPGWIIQIGRWLIDEGVPKMEEFGQSLGAGVGRGIKAAIDRWGPDLMRLINRYASPSGAIQAGIDLAAGNTAQGPTRPGAAEGSAGMRKLEGFGVQGLGVGAQKLGDFSSQWWVNELGMNPYQYTLGGALQQQTAIQQGYETALQGRLDAMGREQQQQLYKTFLRMTYGAESEVEALSNLGLTVQRDSEGTLLDSGIDFGGLFKAWLKNNDLPSFAGGGVVPGALGSPQLAVVHGGETVSNGGGLVVNINGPVYGIDDLESKIGAAIQSLHRRGGLTFLGAS